MTLKENTEMENLDALVGIVGGGMAGICIGSRLHQAGIGFIVFEAEEELGGTWLKNQYPGVSCDIDTDLYQYSFAKNPNWGAARVPGTKILAYLIGVAKSHGMGVGESSTHVNTNVNSAVFDEDTSVWTVKTTNNISGQEKEFRFRYFVAATGQLNKPKVPNFVGADSFQGEQYHSTDLKQDFTAEGKSVVCIGTGPTAAQLYPKIQKTAKEICVVQRSPTHYLPLNMSEYSALGKKLRQYGFYREFIYRYKRAFSDTVFDLTSKRHPKKGSVFEGNAMSKLTQGLLRRGAMQTYGISYSSYKKKYDSECTKEEFKTRMQFLKDNIFPKTALFCKRACFTEAWYPMFLQKNVSLETSGITSITPEGVCFSDGTVRKCDMIIYATGYKSQTFCQDIDIQTKYSNDRVVSLREKWKDHVSAYIGSLIDEMPNFFMLYGPNSNLTHSSVLTMIEIQTNFLVRVIKAAEATTQVVCVSSDEYTRYNDRLQKELESRIFAGPCNSWYRDESGRSVNNWSGTVGEFSSFVSGLKLSHFLTPRL